MHYYLFNRFIVTGTMGLFSYARKTLFKFIRATTTIEMLTFLCSYCIIHVLYINMILYGIKPCSILNYHQLNTGYITNDRFQNVLRISEKNVRTRIQESKNYLRVYLK